MSRILNLVRRAAVAPRRWRVVIAVALDAITCVLSVWLALSIRLGVWDFAGRSVAIVLGLALPSWLLAAAVMGIYRSIIRTSGARSLIDLIRATSLFALPMILVFMFMGVNDVPRTVGILQPILFLMGLATNRLAIRYLLVDILGRGSNERRVAIYGAGATGQQLGLAMRQSLGLQLVAFIDDDPSLVGHRIDGTTIHAGSDLASVVEERDISEIVLAIPKLGRARRLEIVENIAASAVNVRSLPNIADLLDGTISINDLREVQVEELLGREPVPPDEDLLESEISGLDVMVTGAGGSIGSELCRQIMQHNPRMLVLVEQSEFALYSMLEELKPQAEKASVLLVPELVDVSSAPTVARLMAKYRPMTVLHAAAYKHVPLVEANPLSGLHNNVMGTLHCALEAERAGVARFILVSTDKAVRPTNIMGASKRICELILQARASEGPSTIFAMVRFGNVLGSSGSVVPRFRAQIAAGGPISLTHRNVTRFFMTIPEASQLVLQAGGMAEGGEVFVLDMGEPIRIYDLAKAMISLSGCTLLDEENPDGDIAIEEVGLRPGEKMYEELLLGDNSESTKHDRIWRAHEEKLSWAELEPALHAMAEAIDRGDVTAAMAIVRRCVPDYRPPDIEDDLRGNGREMQASG